MAINNSTKVSRTTAISNTSTSSTCRSTTSVKSYNTLVKATNMQKSGNTAITSSPALSAISAATAAVTGKLARPTPPSTTATTTKALTSQTAGFAKEEAKGKSTDGESRKLHATSKQPTHQHSLHSHKAAKNVCDNARKYATNKRITIICICVCVRIYLHIRRSDTLVVRNGARVVAQTAVARTTQT